MTCDDQPARVTWEIDLYEPASRVWMCRGMGRATTTTARPADIAQAVLAGYLAATPPRGREQFRATARAAADGEPVTVTAEELPDGSWTADEAVRQALPLYLRDALPGG